MVLGLVAPLALFGDALAVEELQKVYADRRLDSLMS
jgi:hypothetical protein